MVAAGNNASGALGTGSTATSSNVFTPISGGNAGVIDVAGANNGGDLLLQ